MPIPQDHVMLLSYLNTQLRDRYASLQALCEDLALSESALRQKMAEIGYEYSAAQNRFI